MTSTILIRDADFVYTFDRDRHVVESGSVLIEGNRIKSIHGRGEPLPRVDRVIDQRGSVVLPGLINVHHHFFQNVTRAVPRTLKCPLLDWLKYLYCLWVFLEPEDVMTATRVAAGELLLTGCTTASDFAYLYPRGRKDIFDAEVKTAAEMGIRLHAVRGCMAVLEGRISRELKGLGIDPAWLIEDKAEILRETERVIGAYHDPARFSMLQVGLGPSSMEYQDERFLGALKEIARERRVLTHFHLHPRPDEDELCRRVHRKRPLEYLEQIGWLDEGTWIAHATRHTAEDVDILARTGARVSHSPSCHLRLGYRVAPIPLMKRKGVPVGLGVDGGASNDSGNMLGELRAAMYVHRIEGVHPGLSWEGWFEPRDIFDMAIAGGARILGREAELGSLEEGKAADLITIPRRTIGFAGAGMDPLGALIFCGHDYRVGYSIVNGRIVVENGKLVGVDEAELCEQADAVTARLLARARSATGLSFA